nr:MAG TPA: hypothetical protein [Caudoviricetes sp.]
MSLKQINDTIMNTEYIVKVFFSNNRTISFADTNNMQNNVIFKFDIPNELRLDYIEYIHEQLLDPRITKINFRKMIDELQPEGKNND